MSISLSVRPFLWCATLTIMLIAAQAATNTAPPLRIQWQAPQQLSISWAGSAPGYVLEQTDDLGVSNLWQSVTPSPLLSGNEYSLTLSPAASSRYFRLEYNQSSGLPPDPSSVAPALDRGQAANFGNTIAFLYAGTNSIQTGLTNGTIVGRQAAVIRGTVRQRDGSVLPGVAVSVLNHAEFGQTISRADGRFDLAVNGGGWLTVNYAKPGFLTAQRSVQVPWQDYVEAPPAILSPLDQAVSKLVLGASAPVQVARGSAQTDADGTRQATLILPSGVSASVVLANGATQAVSSLTVRATEFTVGTNGPSAMPAALPPTSGYTYAVDFSADEARAAGATSVVFDHPIYTYVENFLDFPVGTAVPMGYYDSAKGFWVPSSNGVVIKVLSVTDGSADLDFTGANTAADAATLAAAGCTPEERRTLASLYSAGQTLWRVPITHFSYWDCNWPYGPPADATAPKQALVTNGGDKLDDPYRYKGYGTVEVQNQAFAEAIGVVGTPYRLHYSSDRMNGCQAKPTLNISLSGATLPASLKRIDLEIAVAGRNLTWSFPAATNQSYAFYWDGLDAYGRAVPSPQKATTRIGYVYPAVYQAPSAYQNNFGFSTGVPYSRNYARQEITTWQEQTSTLYPVGNWTGLGQNLGGWSLNVQHVYDSAGKRLYLGDGRQRQTERSCRIINTLAGTGQSGFSGDGGPAGLAKVSSPYSLVMSSDGSLVFFDLDNNRIRKIDADGNISTVAGGGTIRIKEGSLAANVDLSSRLGSSQRLLAFGPDGNLYFTLDGKIWRLDSAGRISGVAGFGTGGIGGPALDAKFYYISALAAGPDGSIYAGGLARPEVGQIWKISTDGRINKYAGSDEGGTGNLSDGNDGPATAAKICRICSMVVRSDGSLFFSETHEDQSKGDLVRRVGPDGIMRAFAGSGAFGYGGDGGPATQCQMAPDNNEQKWLALGPDGSLYIFDRRHIRCVGPDGIIYTVAGPAVEISNAPQIGDGGPASQAFFTWQDGLAIGPKGDLYVGDIRRIRQITSLLPGFSESDIALASEDGRELYQFNSQGQHLRTLDGLTFATRYQFAYDARGRLAGITDGNGQTTAIERNLLGNPTAIISPLSQRTVLELNADGLLAKIANPAGESVQFAYAQGGLLNAVTDPLGAVYSVAYDSLGCVHKAMDSAGGSTTLERAHGPAFFKVAATTAEGRTTVHQVQNVTPLSQKLTDTFSDGSQTQVTLDNDGNQDMVLRDGTRISVLKGPDPLFSMQAPRIATNTITLPSKLAFTRVTSRAANLKTPGDIATLTQLLETNKLNDAVYTSIYNAGTRSFTNTTPEGRQTWATIDALGRVVAGGATGLAPATWTYDAQGRVAGFVIGSDADARTNTYTYDATGRLSALVDPLGQSTQFSYDSAGRLDAKSLYDSQGTLVQSVQYGYDKNGNRTSIQPPGRPAHTFTYTTTELTASYTAPAVAGVANPQTLFSYNRDRQITRIQRPDGIVVDYSYDPAGRVSHVHSSDGLLDTTFTYRDTTGQLLHTATADGVETAYQYDGGLLTNLVWTGAVTGKVQWSWDKNFLVSKVVVQDQTIPLQYDRDGLLNYGCGMTITRDPANQKNGAIVGTQYGSVTASWVYNAFGEPSNYTVLNSGSPCYSAQYERDRLGRITRKVETVGGTTNIYDYAYDAAGRLAAMKLNGAGGTTYTYDHNGNRLSAASAQGTWVGTYDDQDRLVQYGTTTYTYGAAGALKTKTAAGHTTTYQYDVAGNLKQAVLQGGTTIQYAVDSQNRRVKRVKGDAVKKYLYGDRLRPLAELDGNDKLVSFFTYASRGNVPDMAIINGRYCRLVTDHLGSVRVVIDTWTSEVLQRMDYDEFGQVTLDTNPGYQPFGFAGGLYDSDTGLVRFGTRDYDPETGRWTAQDPLGFDQPDSNLYAYCANDPVNCIDSGGQGALALGLGVSGGVAAGGTLSASIVIDDKGNVGVMFTGGTGGFGGASGSVGISGGLFSAKDIYEMRGHSDVGGASGGEVLSLGTETTMSSTYYGQSINVGVGGGTPAEAHLFSTESAVYGFNLLHPFGVPKQWTPPPPPPSLLWIKHARQQDQVPMTSVPDSITAE